MLLAYLDESGSVDHHTVGGLLLDESRVNELSSLLDEVVRQAHFTFDIPLHAELHGNPLLGAKDDWKGMKPHVRARINVYHDALQAIASTADGFYFSAASRSRFAAKYPQYKVHPATFSICAEKIHADAVRRGERVLLVHDECSTQPEMRHDIRRYRRNGMWGGTGSQWVNVVDNVLFGPSDYSRALQAADLVTFIVRRNWYHVERDDRARAANEMLMAIVRPLIKYQRAWV